MTKEILNGLRYFLETHIKINCYALENAVLGNIAPNEQIPVVDYFHDLNLYVADPALFAKTLKSDVISDDCRILNQPHEYFCNMFFCDQMNIVFDGAPKFSRGFRKDGFYDFKYGLCDYLISLYNIFKQIIAMPITFDTFDLLDTHNNINEYYDYIQYVRKLLVAIKVRRLRVGSCVNRYIKGIPYVTKYLNAVIKVNKNNFFLSNSNPDYLNYKIALLSSFDFATIENKRIFELKIDAWLNAKKANA